MAQPSKLAAQSSVPPDWVRASAHMQANDPVTALPYLEKMVREHPDVAIYRLDLGYALFLLERDSRAQYHFKQARGADLTPDQRRAVDATMAKIDGRKIWSVRLGFNIEPASNAGKGTTAGSIDVGGLVLPIPDTLRSKAATGGVLTAGATYRPRLNDQVEASFSLDTLMRYYKDKNLRETVVIGRGGLRFSPKQNVFVEGGVLLGTTHAGGFHFNDRYGVYASYTTPLGQRASARVGVEHYQLDHESFVLADGRRTQIDWQLIYALSPNALLRGRGYVVHTDADGSLQSGWQGALTVGGTYAFKGGLIATLDLTTGLDRRDGTSRLTGVRREDKSLAIEAGFYNSKFQIGPFTPVMQMKYQRNRSNEVLNSYSNRSISVGLRTSF